MDIQDHMEMKGDTRTCIKQIAAHGPGMSTR